LVAGRGFFAFEGFFLNRGDVFYLDLFFFVDGAFGLCDDFGLFFQQAVVPEFHAMEFFF
jgi:hypothetical protein